MRAPRSESTRLASLQSEFSLTPAGTKNAGHVTGSFSIRKNLAFIMIARRGSYKPGTKQNGSLPLSGRGQRFCLCTPEQALMTPQDREVPVPVAYWVMVLILDVKTVSFVAAPLQSDRCPVTKGQKDMIEVVRGKANCENLRTHRGTRSSGGGRAGLIVVLVASFPLSIAPSVSARPRGQLATSSTSLNFGSVLEGSSASQHGTLSNTG